MRGNGNQPEQSSGRLARFSKSIYEKKMNKNILKNSWVLAVMIILATVVLNLLISIFIDIGTVMVAVATMIAAMFTGQIYFIAFKEIMPKILRLKTALNYLCIQVVLLCLTVFALGIFGMWALALMFGVALIASAVVYLAIGWGGRMQMKAAEKKK